MNKRNTCCSANSGCCAPKPMNKDIIIDFLYLDLSICERCQGTDTNLQEAIDDVKAVLQAAGYTITLNKVEICSEALAVQYAFVTSPTIRIGGKDIAFDVFESSCQECGDLCGDDVDCRVWEYEGEKYLQPPKAMIVNEILKEVYAGGEMTQAKEEYTLPENLKKFFAGRNI